MLKSLSISQFGIYENVVLEFDQGLNVITGETGSGKSLIISALGAIRGLRVDSAYVRSNQEEARISAIFEIDGKEQKVTRVISAKGKTTSIINDDVVTLANLNELTSSWFDVIGQNSSQIIFEHDFIAKIIDSELSDKGLIEKQNYENLWKQFKTFLELNQRYENKQKILQQKDILEFQLNELKTLDLENVDELLDINARIDGIVAQNENKELLYNFLEELTQSQKELDAAIHTATKNAYLQNHLAELKTASNIVNDVVVKEESNTNIENLDDEINRLMSVKYALDSLSKKYGPEVDDLILHKKTITQELDDINQVLDLWDIQSEKRDEYVSSLKSAGEALAKEREKSANNIEDRVKENLKKLLMDGSSIKFSFNEIAPNSLGVHELELLVETNKNEGLKPIEKAVSGGELARILLAFWQNINSNESKEILICDEIDAGIGGETGIAIGKEMKNLSSNRQLICVTHLSQVAACAPNHIFVEKNVDEKEQRNVSTVKNLNENEKLYELARMLSGSQTTSALEHAKELLVELNNVN